MTSKEFPPLNAVQSKATPYYSKDDTYILADLPSLGRSEEHEEFASLFHKSRTGHELPPIHVGLELELLRNSLGKLGSHRNSKSHEIGYSPATSNFDEDVENTRPLSPGVYNLLKDLENCLEKTQRSDEPITPCESEFHPMPVGLKLNRDQTPSIYSSTQPSSMFKYDALMDRNNDILEYKPDSFVNPAPERTPSVNGANYDITVNEAFMSATLAGWLSKLYITNPSFLARKTWKRRFFILSSNILYRFKSLQANTTADEHLEINSNTIACVSDKFPGKKWVIEITNPGTSWYIQAECLDELKTWLNALKSAVIRSKFNGRVLSSESESVESANLDSIDEYSSSHFSSSISIIEGKIQARSVSRSSMPFPPQLPVPQGKPPLPPNSLHLAATETEPVTHSNNPPEWNNPSVDKFLGRIRPSGPSLLTRRLQNHVTNPDQDKRHT
ncbi:hypothetical protein K7432_005154 [Basidiobolus ranarum]|uniref:PH domain-containing protein n=1 Tax=Basidiobolus ranarum TaxID=34480 RepID=A0ABR2W4J1_9FUNG